VRYRLQAEPQALFTCHCHQCQKQSGSAFGMALWLRYSAFEVLGELGNWVRDTPLGRPMRCQFCPQCGTRLFHWSSTDPGVVSIKPGTLDDTAWLVPRGHIWLESGQRWAHPQTGCLFDGNPPDFAGLRF
jgi:hypothetical protein